MGKTFKSWSNYNKLLNCTAIKKYHNKDYFKLYNQLKELDNEEIDNLNKIEKLKEFSDVADVIMFLERNTIL